MFGLLLTTIATSAVDSLNPIAITQQFVLQGMVKKPKHIWFFIIPTGVVNMLGGFLAYFGLVSFIGDFFSGLITQFGQALFTAELIFGIAFLIAVSFMIQKRKLDKLEKQLLHLQGAASEEEDDQAETTKKIKSVSPPALIALGAGATVSELTTALPYFAFMAILLGQNLSVLQVSILLVIYNFIYALPLMILYFVYVKAQTQFDKLYLAIKKQITRWSNILAPTLVAVVGVFFIFHSLSRLLSLAA